MDPETSPTWADLLRGDVLDDIDPGQFVVTHYRVPEAMWLAMHHHWRIRTIAAFMFGLTAGAALATWLG